MPLVRADLTSLSSWESSFKLSLERCIDPIWGARQSGLDSAGLLLSAAPSLEMEAESGSPSPLAHAGSCDARGWGGLSPPAGRLRGDRRSLRWWVGVFCLLLGPHGSAQSQSRVLKASPLNERGF